MLRLLLPRRVTLTPTCAFCSKKSGATEGQVGVRQDDAHVKERAPVPQPQVDDVSDARLFEVGQVAGVVDMPLRIEVGVAHLDGMVEAEAWHAPIIPLQISGIMGGMENSNIEDTQPNKIKTGAPKASEEEVTMQVRPAAPAGATQPVKPAAASAPSEAEAAETQAMDVKKPLLDESAMAAYFSAYCCDACTCPGRAAGEHGEWRPQGSRSRDSGGAGYTGIAWSAGGAAGGTWRRGASQAAAGHTCAASGEERTIMEAAFLGLVCAPGPGAAGDFWAIERLWRL